VSVLDVQSIVSEYENKPAFCFREYELCSFLLIYLATEIDHLFTPFLTSYPLPFRCLPILQAYHLKQCKRAH
jgi:hypothetical protein